MIQYKRIWLFAHIYVCESIGKLKVANVKVEFDVYEGCYHGFDLENVPIAKQAKTRLIQATKKLLNGPTL